MKIQVGDIVDVHCHIAQYTLGTNLKVEYIPCQPDDYWHFYNEETGELIATNEKVTVIRKLKK